MKLPFFHMIYHFKINEKKIKIYILHEKCIIKSVFLLLIQTNIIKKNKKIVFITLDFRKYRPGKKKCLSPREFTVLFMHS